MLAWASAGGQSGHMLLEIDFLLRNTLISLYKLHFRKIVPLLEVLPPLEIGYGTPTYASFITNVNRRSNNVNQHAINALESMKNEDKYSNYIANKATNKRFLCSLHKYANLHHHPGGNSKVFDRKLRDAFNRLYKQRNKEPSREQHEAKWNIPTVC